MRLKLVLSSPNGLELPLGYQQMLQGIIYRTLSNPDLAEFMHDEGFFYGKRSYKLFTFSQLRGKSTVDKRRATIAFRGTVTWEISSVITEMIEDLAVQFLLSSYIEMNGHRVRVLQVSTEREEQLPSTGPWLVQMISPVTVYQTELRDERKYTKYMEPSEPLFAELITQNMQRKYCAFTGEKDVDFSIRPVQVSTQDKVLTYYKKFLIVGWKGIYELSGPADVLAFSYFAGLGSKASQGYGMYRLIGSEKTKT
ncbi:CRISPR-associated endoribonuclease Cas6 [Paenibacillus sp. 481]|uniref:CRISPR-associated endoribonuclease Cas6 n=1 Tax=Paenibacillus sp. 481 TaxID=2835869 RepID=UPI001E2845BE|nr:CRISPR-associated endoribonuclease Cas6 [Paenibacillus sp. 481]UHA72126.1 CRISPR-associated endoribonuclease Cas6 [Paenibacillus sp. 481]